MEHKNIHLFRGDNTHLLKKTVQEWCTRFKEKHDEMNLLLIDRENYTDELMADCLAPGFMGMTRMVVFRELLLKTPREISAEEKEKEDGESINLLEDKPRKSANDEAWIRTLGSAPDKNFILFVGNKKPVSDLEKWLETNATIHEFVLPTPQEMNAYVSYQLGLTDNQAREFCRRLNFFEDFQYGKNVTIGKPDFIYMEVEKYRLVGQKSWSNEELDRTLPDYREEISFTILDPLWDRDTRKIHTIWNRLMETADHELTMASIITMIRKILICAAFPNIGEIPVTRGQRNTGSKLQKSLPQLRKLYDDIIAVDIAEKTGNLTNKADAYLMALLRYTLT